MRPQVAIGIRTDDLHHRDFGQLAGRRQLALAAAVDIAGALQLLQHRLQRDALGPFEVEGARDLVLADRAVAFLDEGQDLFLGRERDMLRPALLFLRRVVPSLTRVLFAIRLAAF